MKKLIIIQNDIKTKLSFLLTVLTVVLKNKLFSKIYKLNVKQCYHIVWSRKNTESKTRRKTSNEKTMLLLKCGMRVTKNSRLSSKQANYEEKMILKFPKNRLKHVYKTIKNLLKKNFLKLTLNVLGNFGKSRQNIMPRRAHREMLYKNIPYKRNWR